MKATDVSKNNLSYIYDAQSGTLWRFISRCQRWRLLCLWLIRQEWKVARVVPAPGEPSPWQMCDLRQVREASDFPGESVVKESTCHTRDLSLIPGSGRSPGEGTGSPLQYSCLKNSMGRGAWQLQSMGWPRVRHDWATNTFTFNLYKYINTLIWWPIVLC